MIRRIIMLCFLLSSIILPSCTYRSLVVETQYIEEELIEEKTYPIEGSSNTFLECKLVEDGNQYLLILEEVETQEYETKYKYKVKKRVIREPEVEVDDANKNLKGSWWAFPNTISMTIHLVQDPKGFGEAVGRLGFALPVMIIVDLVTLPVHIGRMSYNDCDDLIEGEEVRSENLIRKIKQENIIPYVERLTVKLNENSKWIPTPITKETVALDVSELISLKHSELLLPSLKLNFIYEKRKHQLDVKLPMDCIEHCIEGKNLDFTINSQRLPPRGAIKVNHPGEVQAGVPTTLTVNIENTGKGDFCDLSAVTISEDPFLNGRRLHFGRIPMGVQRSSDLNIIFPEHHLGGRIPVLIEFSESNGRAPESINLEVDVKPLPRPRLVVSYRLYDDNSGNSIGNSDGRIQRREVIDLLLTIHNEGDGTASNVELSLYGSHNGVRLIDASKAVLGKLSPGQSQQRRYTFEITPDFDGKSFWIETKLDESAFDLSNNQKFMFSLDDRVVPRPTDIDRKMWILKDSAAICEGVGQDSRVLFELGKNTPVRAKGVLESYYRVEFNVEGKTETGWIAQSDVTRDEPRAVAGATISPTVVVRRENQPPVLAVSTPKQGQQFKYDQISFVAVAGDDSRVIKTGVLLNGKEIAVSTRDLSLANATTEPTQTAIKKNAGNTTAQVEAKLNLSPGINTITFYAIDDADTRNEVTVEVERLTAKSETFIAVIGINDYTHPKIPDLVYAENDAQAVFDALKTGLGVDDAKAFSLLGEKATRGNILDLLSEKIPAQAGEEDTVVVYFAGHGAIKPDRTNQTDGLAKFFVPVGGDPDRLMSSSISTTVMGRALGWIASDRLVFIADACFAGAQGRSFSKAFRAAGISDDVFSEIAGRSGRVVMAACAANEVAQEDSKVEHGIYTAALLEALSGAADVDGDGLVTVDEVHGFVSKQVRKRTNGQQNPVMEGKTVASPVLSTLN